MLNSNMVVDWDSEMAEVERITFDFKITEEVVGEVAYMMNYTGESLNYLYWHDSTRLGRAPESKRRISSFCT